MQNAKDSFYVALRDRLATINPERVISLRGIERPAVLVEEAEAPVGEVSNGVFVLQWTTLTCIDTATPLMQMECEIRYSTCGSTNFSGLDRGRALTKMDGELISAFQPMSTQKMNFETVPATALQTQVFWGNAVFGGVITTRDQLQRVATLKVFSFLESGEL